MPLRKLAPLLVLTLVAGQATAISYFGKNKVHYYRYDWQIIEGDHVDLYFYGAERELAERAAALAEESWEDLTARMAFTPRSRVPLIIYSSHGEFEETNILPYILPEGVAGFTELFKNRVVVPFDGSYARFRRVIRHEMGHYFLYEKLRDVYRRHNRYDYGAPPFWLVEGFSEYIVGDADAISDMVMADALYCGAFTSLTRPNDLTGSYLGYKEGESALRYLAATYGEDKVLRLLDDAWLSRDYRKVLDLAMPVPFKDFDEEWQRDVRRHYWPRYARREEFLALGQRLSTEGYGLRSGVAWLDRQRLVYLSDEDGYANLYLATVDEQGRVLSRRKLVQGERSESFVVVHVYQERPATWGGNLVAFTARAGARDRLNVYDVTRGRVVEYYAFDDLISLGSPYFSPDGGDIVFRGVTRGGKTDLYVVSRASRERRQLTSDLADDAYPCWTPEGIVFASGRDAGPYDDYYNLYRLEPATGETKRLTAGRWRDLYPGVDASGALYFVSDREGMFDVYRLDAGGAATRFSRSLTGVLEAAPRPGGAGGEVAAVGIAGQNYQIVLASLEAEEELATPAGPPAVGPALAPPGPAKSYPVKGYRTKYGLDYFSAEVAYGPEFGTQTGVIVSLTDQLNDQSIFLEVGNDAETLDEFLDRTSVGVDYYNLHRRVGYGVGAFHYVNDYFDFQSGLSGLNYSETRAGAGATVTYPFDRFHRVGASLYGYEMERRWEIPEIPPEYGTKVAPYVTASRDTALWFRDGPVDGQRFEAIVGVTEDVKRRRQDYIYTSLDLRHYQRTTRTQCFAFRTLFVGTFGPDARPLYGGGSLSMRGYKFYDFRGQRFAMVNAEYRFPILEPFPLRTALGTATMPPVRGALFFDTGNGWDTGFGRPRGGFGLSLRVVLGSVLTLRTDHSILTDFKSLGPFVPIKFFVGWSY